MARYSVYLAGPITGHVFPHAADWREEVRDGLAQYIQIETVSPLRHKFFPVDNPIPDSEESDPLNSRRGIYARCRQDVINCNLVVANLCDARTRPTFGTVIEITIAKEWDVPILAIMDDKNIHWHNMLREQCDYVVPSLAQAIDLIPRILLPDDAF